MIYKRLRNPRKIKWGLIGISGICYRIHIIIIQSLFWYVFYGIIANRWEWAWAISSSIIWNIFNTLLYFNWHLNFARYFKVGKD